MACAPADDDPSRWSPRLLVLGLVQMINAARIGTAARRMAWPLMVAVALPGGAFTALMMPGLLKAFPGACGLQALPRSDSRTAVGEVAAIGSIFCTPSLVSPNIIDGGGRKPHAAADDLFVMFASGITRPALPDQGDRLLGVLPCSWAAMSLLLIIFWVAEIGWTDCSRSGRPSRWLSPRAGSGCSAAGAPYERRRWGHYVLTRGPRRCGFFILLLGLWPSPLGWGAQSARLCRGSFCLRQAVGASTEKLARQPARGCSTVAGRLGP